MRTETLPPGIHGPSLRWYRPSGLAYWLVRSTVRFWITGRPVWGPGDNATFLRDATIDRRGGPREKLTRARWRRLAWRWGAVGVPVLLYALLGWWAILTYLTFAAGGAGYLGRRALLEHRESREFVYPTWQVVARVLGEKYSRRAAVRAVQLTPDPLEARIHLPVVPLDDGQRKRIVASAAERLGIADPSASWTVRGAVAHVDIRPRVHPPMSLTYAEVRRLVLDADMSKPFIGLGPGRTPVYADLDNDGPHIGVSAGTGAGKSTLLRLVLARRMADGVGLVVCDYKVTSHPFARRIAAEDPHRAVYATEEHEISEAILAVYAEFMRRREVLKTRPEDLSTFRPVDLLVEELNSLASKLRTWWGHERRRIAQEAKDREEPVPYLPVVPECVDALGALVQMGRELRVHVHVAAQRLDASILAPKDGGAVRESFQNRFLAKYTKKAWDMLCGGIPFQAFPGGPRGIWVAVVNGEVTFFRVPLMSDTEAYQLAMSGEPPAGPVLGGARLIRPHEQGRLVTLGEAWELLGYPSRDALVKAVQRAQIPAAGQQGNAKLYDYRALESVQGKR